MHHSAFNAPMSSSTRKTKADLAMEEGGGASSTVHTPLGLGMASRTNSGTTYEDDTDTATANSSLDHGDAHSSSSSSSSSGEGEEDQDPGEAFEQRTRVLFPGRHAGFDGLDPLSI